MFEASLGVVRTCFKNIRTKVSVARTLGSTHCTEIKKEGNRGRKSKCKKKERKKYAELGFYFSGRTEGPRSDSPHHENKNDNDKKTFCQISLKFVTKARTMK